MRNGNDLKTSVMGDRFDCLTVRAVALIQSSYMAGFLEVYSSVFFSAVPAKVWTAVTGYLIRPQFANPLVFGKR